MSFLFSEYFKAPNISGEQKNKKKLPIAPWVRHNNEEALKKKILVLSDVLRAPPSGVNLRNSSRDR